MNFLSYFMTAPFLEKTLHFLEKTYISMKRYLQVQERDANFHSETYSLSICDFLSALPCPQFSKYSNSAIKIIH